MKDWIMILAVLCGPVLAVQVQKYLDVLRERRYRKLRVFQSLMATRSARVSAEHVQALNMIDIEFYGRKYFWLNMQSKSEKSVISAWRTYQEHLNTKYSEGELEVWSRKGDDLFSELLFRMSRDLGYNFDTIQLRRGCYSPVAHGEIEMENLLIRKNLVKILSGEESLPISLVIEEDILHDQKIVQKKFLEYLDGKIAVRVKYEPYTKPDDNQ